MHVIACSKQRTRSCFHHELKWRESCKRNYVNLLFQHHVGSHCGKLLSLENKSWKQNAAFSTKCFEFTEFLQKEGDSTVWKIQYFSTTQLLCEINFGHFEASKTTFLIISAVLEIEFLGILDIFRCKILTKIKINNL